MNNNNIEVTVKFFAMLREYGPAKETIVIPKDSKVELLFKKYQIPREVWQTVIIVNGRPHNNLETVLKNGDIISIFPPIGGG
ncbi:MAG: MoaD/ThiS family protein [Candidatus Hermodarchaeota archaeon]